MLDQGIKSGINETKFRSTDQNWIKKSKLDLTYPKLDMQIKCYSKRSSLRSRVIATDQRLNKQIKI